MTNLQKNAILQSILLEKSRLGSGAKLANKCGVSTAMVSNIINGKWDDISEDMWLKIANKVGHEFSDWQIAETMNYRIMQTILGKAQQECLFIPVSYRAGAGKTEGIKGFMKANHSEFQYYLQCREWGRREFITALMQAVGMEVPRGNKSIDQLGQMLIDHFVNIGNQKPFVVLDQANSLKPAAVRWLIQLYNEMEDRMAVVIVGTEALEKEIKRGVRYSTEGYDELDSRFGRNFQKLVGYTQEDVSAICNINGLTDTKMHKALFDECSPTHKKLGNDMITVVEDARRIKRVIKREKLKQA